MDDTLMTIERKISIPPYEFTITIQTKTVHAHAALTDAKCVVEQDLRHAENAILHAIQKHKEKTNGITRDSSVSS